MQRAAAMMCLTAESCVFETYTYITFKIKVTNNGFILTTQEMEGLLAPDFFWKNGEKISL